MHNNLGIASSDYLIPLADALKALDAEGLQSPSPGQLEEIVDVALQATGLFTLVAVLPVTPSDIREFFTDFVVRCVNRGPGVGDATAN